ncbi:hypothetical protein [Opacimonas viscosa]|uniref:Uncharacterized protein n=1 Tax=Opacimonas viscosa TaxID=2961944 RepID=A0AA42BM40_9ALTE|nr:hypothetical protein [Opacimonas viscosa]MCP3429563.1 hypothetical protein [Opacimonas viscosa]
MKELEVNQLEKVNGGSTTEVMVGAGMGVSAGAVTGVIGKLAFGAAMANPVSLTVGALVAIGYGLSRMGRDQMRIENHPSTRK